MARRRRLLDRFRGGTRWTDDVTVVGPGLTFEGEIRAPGPVVVAGLVMGSIVSQDLVRVLAGGVVIGTIDAEAALIEGAVDGPVHVADHLEIGATGRVRGEISGTLIAVADGSYVLGNILSRSGAVHRFQEGRRARA